MDINDYQNYIIKKIVKCMEKNQYFKNVKSIIITGSLGRREPTYKKVKNEIELKSDIEIGVIYKGKRKDINKLFNDITPKFKEDLNLMPITMHRIIHEQNYNYALLNNKKKTLFTYDLYNSSYTAWGEDYLINRKISIENVDLYEAKKIVGNRIGELIYLSSKNTAVSKQWKSKLILAIGTAWLLLNSNYNSAYKYQFKQINEKKDDINNFFENDFTEIYNKSYTYLRKNGAEVDIEDKVIKKYVKKINNLFAEKKLIKSHVNTLSRMIKIKYRIIKSAGLKGLFINENTIYDNLINNYIKNNKQIEYDSELWHKTLY